MKRARKDGLEEVGVVQQALRVCIRYLLDKFAQNIASEHVFCVPPKLERIVCSQAFGQIGHAFCLVILRELSSDKRNRGVGEEMIKV